MISPILRSDYTDWYDHAFARPTRPDPDHPVFHRNMTDGPARHEALGLLKAVGFRMPLYYHGPLGELDKWPEIEVLRATAAGRQIVDHMLVVCHFGANNLHHAGEGKELTTLAQLRLMPASTVATIVQFMPSNQLQSMNSLVANPLQGKSLRLLLFGDDARFIQYRSSTDWRSNCGDVEVAVLPEQALISIPVDLLYGAARRLQRLLKAPLLAIDFVEFDEPHHLHSPPPGVYANSPPPSVHSIRLRNCYAIDLNVSPGLQPLKDHVTATQIHDAIVAFMVEQRK